MWPRTLWWEVKLAGNPEIFHCGLLHCTEESMSVCTKISSALWRCRAVQDLTLCFSRAAAPPGWKESPAGTSLSLKFTAHNTWLCVLQRYRWSPLVPSISFSPAPTRTHAAIPLWTRRHLLREGTSAAFPPFQWPLRKGLYHQT